MTSLSRVDPTLNFAMSLTIVIRKKKEKKRFEVKLCPKKNGQRRIRILKPNEALNLTKLEWQLITFICF